MRRYFEIVAGCFIAGIGVTITVVCVDMINALFGGTMLAARMGAFEITVNNALIPAVFVLGFGLALIFVGGGMALEADKPEG
jgi:hypothetical protein